jgi:hypothetical protein
MKNIQTIMHVEVQAGYILLMVKLGTQQFGALTFSKCSSIVIFVPACGKFNGKFLAEVRTPKFNKTI